jgi:hypothetical protein
MALLLTLMFVACCRAGFAQLKVAPSGPPMGDGSSWNNPLPAYKLQKAIDDGATGIWLKEGAYPLLRLRAGTSIKGGYSGNPLLEEERDPNRYRSYISGVRIGPHRMLPDGSIEDDPSIYPGVMGIQIPQNILVDGCTLLPSASGTEPPGGQCIACFGARDYPTFTNCILQGSGANNMDVGAYAMGGFMYEGNIFIAALRLVDCEIKDQGLSGALASGYGSFDLVRCQITRCRLGIGVYSSNIDDLPPTQKQLTMTDCRIQNNGTGAYRDGLWNAGFGWGGAHILGGTKARISQSEFSDNTGFAYGGGLSLIGAGNGRVALSECTITRNIGTVGAAGGVVCDWNDLYKTHADVPDAVVFTDCTISENVTQAGGLSPYEQSYIGGAGIRTRTAGVQLTRCTIVRNHSEMVGGGVYLGASGEASGGGYGPPVTLRSCLIAHNTADGRGGGVYIRASDPQILNCTLADNSSPLGGAIYAYSVQASVYSPFTKQPALFANCALTGNMSSLGTILLHDGVSINGSYPPPLFKRCTNAASDTWLQHYTVLPTPTHAVPPPTSDGNILVAAPHYVNPAGGDYHLLSTSPLIERGDNAFVLPGDKDVEGLTRILGAFVDIGAYEFAGSTVSISGTLTLENIASTALAQPITFTFRPVDNSAVIVRTFSFLASGPFSVPGLPKKNYTLHVKGAKWLAVNVSADASRGNISGVTAHLKAGDANDDNRMDVLDLVLLIQAFDSIDGASNWNEDADFNCDGSVDVLDLDLLIRNFNRAGDV